LDAHRRGKFGQFFVGYGTPFKGTTAQAVIVITAPPQMKGLAQSQRPAWFKAALASGKTPEELLAKG